MKRLLQFILITISFVGCNNNSQNKKGDNLETTSSIVDTTLVKQNENVILDNLMKMTVAISLYDANKQPISYGSGIVIEDGVIATNLHVIENAVSGTVNFEGIDYDISGYLGADKQNDLVLLSVPIEAKGLSFSQEETLIGDKIFVAGNPVGLDKTLSDGIISNLKRELNGVELIQITTPISPGSSGGPVINDKGELIGIACGSLTNGQNLNFAIPIEFLKILLNEKGDVKPLNFRTNNANIKVNLNNKYSEWISVRNISTIDLTTGGKYILCFSLYNKTQYTISDVKILMIAYDSEGIPTDYRSYNFFPQGILPGLSKEVERVYPPSKYIEEPKNGKIVYRVLSYDIYE